MIIYSEISDSGISSDDYATITNSSQGFLHSVVIQRQNPEFTLHDRIARSGDLPFSAAADDTKIVRCYNDGDSYYAEYLLIEDDDPDIVEAWSTPELLGSAKPGVQPKVCKQNSQWEIITVDSAGDVFRWVSSDGTGSWSDSPWADTGIGDGVDDNIVAYGGDIETLYYWKFDETQVAYELRYLLADDGGDLTTEIFWHEKPYSMDCEVYYDTSDDKNGLIDQSDVRHALVMSLPMPSLYVYKDIQGQPQKTEQLTGGLVSFIVRPHLESMRVFAQFSTHHAIQLFDNFNSLQYRKFCHLTMMSSVFDPDSDRDTFWCSAIGADGDINGADTSFSYNALYYYSSRTNKHWSQDSIIPIPSSVSFDEFAAGVQLIKLGNYLYALSGQTALRSLLSLDFGGVHPEFSLDVTPFVESWHSDFKDMRQTSVGLVNRDSALSNTMLNELGSYAMITKFGKKIDSTTYLFQISLEEVDSVQAVRNNPKRDLVITARDYYSRLAEKTQAADAIEYDNQLTGYDNFHEIGGVANSGLAHTAVTSGTWGTEEGVLKLVSRYKEGVAFTTFESLTDNGSIEIPFSLPIPGAHDTPPDASPSSGDQPTYGGVVFRAIDKSNFWWVRYDYYAEEIIVGVRQAGVDTFWFNVDPGAYFISQANNELPVTIRVEYKYNQIKVYTTHASDSSLEFLFSYALPGKTVDYAPMMAGSAGYILCGFSDEDTSVFDDEPLPDILLADLGDDFSIWPDAGYDPLPADKADPPPGYVAPFDGNTVMIWSESQIGVTKQYIKATNPLWIDITPSDLSGWIIQQCVFDPFSTKTKISAYMLANNGVNSAVWYATDVFSGHWSKGPEFIVPCSIIRTVFDTPGEVEVYNDGENSTIYLVDLDFTAGDQGWSVTSTGGQYIASTYDGSNGFKFGHSHNGAAVTSEIFIVSADPWGYTDPIHQLTAYLDKPLCGHSGDRARFYFSANPTIEQFPCDDSFFFDLPTYSGGDVSTSALAFSVGNGDEGHGTPTDYWVEKIRIVFSDASITPHASTRRITGYGTVVGARVTVTDAEDTTGGFDVTHKGHIELAGGDQLVRKASIGGTYSDDPHGTLTTANPLLILIPWRLWASDGSLNYDGPYPDYLLGADEDESGEALWKVSSSARTDITPSGATAVVGPNCASTYLSNRIAILMTKSGATHLFTTTNAHGTPTWTDRGALAGAIYIRVRYLAKKPGQLFIAGGTVLKYSSTFGASTWPRTGLFGSGIKGIEALG